VTGLDAGRTRLELTVMPGSPTLTLRLQGLVDVPHPDGGTVALEADLGAELDFQCVQEMRNLLGNWLVRRTL
jgi:hypothetical protein